MTGLSNSMYLMLYIISNVVALLIILAAWKNERMARLMLFIVFAWASWTNWNEALTAPQFYLDYAGLTFSGWYKSFINGWFSNHITVAVVFIATCQALIAISMILKGWIFKTGAVGAIVFLLAIVPLGVGSAFPCTLILAISVWIVLRHKQIDYLWLPHSKKIPAF